MFIPLNINNANKIDVWPNVLIAGDTAGIFYLLSRLSHLEANIFLADTGVKGVTPVEFRCGRSRKPDSANVYYDFFEGQGSIGAGIIRRMNFLLGTSCARHTGEWAKAFRVPSAYMELAEDMITLEFEGASPGPEGYDHGPAGCTISEILSRFIYSPGRKYIEETYRACIDRSGASRIVPATFNGDIPPRIIPLETPYSTWDDIHEVLGDDETIVQDIPGNVEKLKVSSIPGGVKMIELGVPELHVLRAERDGSMRFLELTGDLSRVFDGIF